MRRITFLHNALSENDMIRPSLLRLAAVCVALIGVTGCNQTSKSTTLNGVTIHFSQPRSVELEKSQFNVPAFFEKIDRLEAKERDNGQTVLYSYFIGNEVAIGVEYNRQGWFNQTTEDHYNDADAARDALAKRGVTGDVTLHPLAGTPRGGGFHAEAYGCSFFAFTKRVKPRTAFTGDRGQPDTVVRGRVCDTPPGTGAAFYKAFGEMNAADQAKLAARLSK